MSITCPYCNGVLNPKGLKPGHFKPKCPKCQHQFLLIVPEDPEGTIAAKKLGTQDQSGPAKAPAPRKVAAADPNSTGAFTEFEKPQPQATAMFQPSGIDDPNTTGAFTEIESRPDRTQAFSPSAVQDPNSTGEFTELDRDVNKTGAFGPSAAGEGTEVFSASEAGGGNPDQTSAFSDDQPAMKAKPKSGPDEIPEKLGGYEVVKVLGKGGMGAVLLGRQTSLNRKVALKIMHSRLAKDPGFVARFTREAYAAAQLVHHNVIQVYDIGQDSGIHYFSMEFVNGKSLMDEVKEKGKLDVEVAVGYTLQAARGLKFGHNQGMIHRDIKPDNLMLNTEGIVKVADLGLVKLPTPDVPQPKGAETDLGDDDADTGMTRAGVVMGTPSYMAPEQSRDSSTVDARADIYSLGCTLYVLVTGKPPFSGKSALEVMSKHQTEPIVPPEQIVRRVPKALSGILQKMLAKKPQDRYQTMDDVILALEAYLGMSRTGPFTPKEEHAQQLEFAASSFNSTSKRGLKTSMSIAFFAVCVLGILGLGVSGMYSWAGGLFGMMLITPIAYFIIQGTMSGSHLFTKFREWLFGCRIIDWLMFVGGGFLFVVALAVFGFLWQTLAFSLVGVGLAYVLWMMTDAAEKSARKGPIESAKSLFKTMRINGLEEESLRQFVCKYAGDDWEELYETLFGYDAKLSARLYRKGAISESGKKFAAWREPIIAWFETKIRERTEEKEREHLEEVQAKALEAKGVSAKDARDQAAALADAMVDQANAVQAAAKEGKPVDLKGMIRTARMRKPPEGYNIAGVKRRDLRFRNMLHNWFGRRLRFVVGAAVFTIGLMWMHQNGIIDKWVAVTKNAAATLDKGIASGNTKGSLNQISTTAGNAASVQGVPGGYQPVKIPIVPEAIRRPLSNYGAVIGGFFLLVSAILYYGYKSSIPGMIGIIVALFGHSFGIPGIGAMVSPEALSGLIGAAIIIVGGRFLRK